MEEKDQPNSIVLDDYKFIVDISVDQSHQNLSIEATETRAKDKFHAVYPVQKLLQMQWLSNDIVAIHQFVNDALFDLDVGMSYLIGFTTDDNVDIANSNKQYEGNNSVMLIQIAYKTKYSDKKWSLQLKYVEENEISKLKSIIFDLQTQLKETMPKGITVYVVW